MSDNLNMDELTETRRKNLAATIKEISTDELKELGTDLFPYFDSPWREKYFEFLDENGSSTFYHAVTHDDVHFIYSPAKNAGIWYLPKSGLGPLQAKGLQIMKEIVEARGR